VGDRAANLREAVERLARELPVGRVSSLFETEPVGLREQPFFLNAVLHLETDRPPREVLAVLKSIEEAMGRKREVALGPRSIDLDLLLYDELEMDVPGLTLPHPRMSERRFVLEPLAEIAPDVRLARRGPSAAERLAVLPEAESVERVAPWEWPPRTIG